MTVPARVWIVDDEVSVLRVTESLLNSLGEFEVRAFAKPLELLAELRVNTVNCIVSDLVMPEIDGMELQRRVSAIDNFISLVFLSGKADVPTTVQLMQNGAVSLLEKPYDSKALANSVRRGVGISIERRGKFLEVEDTIHRIYRLDSEELEVMQCIYVGLSNKTAAYRLSLSSRTFDRRRQSVLQTLGVDSPVELAANLERCKPYLPNELQPFLQRPKDLAHRLPET